MTWVLVWFCAALAGDPVVIAGLRSAEACGNLRAALYEKAKGSYLCARISDHAYLEQAHD